MGRGAPPETHCLKVLGISVLRARARVSRCMYIDGMAIRMVALMSRMLLSRFTGLYWGTREMVEQKYTEDTRPLDNPYTWYKGRIPTTRSLSFKGRILATFSLFWL